MPFDIQVEFEATGGALYALLFNSDNDCWNGVEFAEFDGDNDTFDIPLTEMPSRASHYYAVLSDPFPPDDYNIEIWVQVGAGPNRASDARIGVLDKYWCGGADYPMELMAMANRTGAIHWTYTVLDGKSEAISGVFVIICGDSDGKYPIAARTSNYRGKVAFKIAKGVYYMFKFKAGYNFENPQYIKIVGS